MQNGMRIRGAHSAISRDKTKLLTSRLLRTIDMVVASLEFALFCGPSSYSPMIDL